ncbi:MAG: efflux family protein [Hydrocarboniphaga sp.]|uniref:MATE family efflux transporter n=1 Tax=Hydrocarboniphaga sp. TaxID=2033016 RepID=UPI00260A7516|nr:MATE family efflux transporter [Hydrocarboniphaga sp.]MDB5971191.1 efflux family protein [Hydrocarboniphaga sp.]
MQDLSSGPIRGHLLRMAAFMLVTMIVQTIYGLIDLFWVGHLGREAIAAVSLGSNLMMAVMAVSQVLAVGASALVSQAMGRKDMPAVAQLFNQSMLVSALMGLLVGAAFFAARQSYASALSSDPATIALTVEFLAWFAPAMALQIPMMVLSSALRGVGNMRISSIAQLATVLMNIVFAPFLIFGWISGVPLGVGGAALATLVAIAIGFAGMLSHVIRSPHYFDAARGAWRVQFPLWRRIAIIGLPSGLELGLMASYMAAVMGLLQAFGPATQAGFGIGMRILQTGMIPSMAISFAAGAIVGQNFGAGRGDRVREAFWLSLRYTLIGAAVFVLMFHLAPQWLIRPFSADPGVIEAGSDFLRLISWNLLGSGVVFACFGVFSGLGDTRPSLISSAIRIALILVPATWLSHRTGFTPLWIWYLSVAATTLQAAMNLFFLQSRFSRLPAADGPATAAHPASAP